ncbi:MAG: amino acid permease [Pseudomonadota bacterium]
MRQTTLQRRLRPRHVAMIALGGTIGSGLYIASGNTVHIAGPGGAILAFAIVGIMVYFLMTSLGEMSSLIPITGTFCDYCTRFVDPAFGFAQSYNYWFSWASAAAVDLSAATLVMKYWFPHIPTIYWSVLFFVVIFMVNALTVSVYGESEYWLSAIKIIAVIVFIVVGFMLIVGIIAHHPIGFHNWTIGDAPFHHGLAGILMVLLVAGFSFQGTEIFGVTSGEVKDPRTSIPRAVKTIFWRIMLFYILTVVVIGFLIPYTDPSLVHASNTNIAMSPFTIIFKRAGLASAAGVMNAVILIAVLSAVSASMYTASRMLWYAAKIGQGPRILAKTTAKGVPLPALIITALFAAVSFLSSVFGSGQVFTWLVNLSGLSGILTWLGIGISHYRFRRAYRLQGHDTNELPYYAKLFPFGPLFAIVLCIIIIIGQQFAGGQHFNWGSFVGTYIGLPVFLILYLGYKIRHKTKLVPLDQCRFDS